MYGYIYKWTNLINGKVGLGKHKSNYIDEKYITGTKNTLRAINKYGIENFSKDILGRYNSLQELNQAEKDYIKEYRELLGKENVYNISDGGDGRTGECSPETRKKISDSKKGQVAWNKDLKMSYEFIKKNSDSHKGQKAWNKDIPMKDETKVKIQNSQLGKSRTPEFKEKLSKTRKEMHENGYISPLKGKPAWNTGKKYFNNGKINKFCEECPEGFVPGRINIKWNKLN